MRKNLITAKTQKPILDNTKMAKPLHGIMNKQSLFRGATPQGEFTNISKTATTNMAINPAQFYSPELTPETWLLPKSRLEILKWCRIYFNLDPYIQSILTMHAQYPISTFRLQYKDKDTEDFFNRKLFEDCQIDWVSFLERLSLSYYVYGEAICWGDWNSVKGTWNDIILIDPALIDYQEDALTGKSVMSLIPTQELKQLVAQALRDGSTNLPADYIACVQDNKQIPLDTEGVEPNYLTGRKYVPPTAFIFARLLSPGSTRGVPIIQQLFKTLIYQDKIRLAQVACLSGDTRIPLLDGTKPTIEYLYKSGRTNFEVYSCNDKGEVVIRRANKVVCNGKKQLYKITLDDGSFIRLTEDHPCMMRDGSFKEVKDLKEHDSLMPFYTRKNSMPKSSDYEQVYIPGLDDWQYTHRLHFTASERKGFVVHHKNFNRFDNSRGNLELVPFKEHGKMHRELLARNQEKMQERFAEVRKTNEYKEIMREAGKKISTTKKEQHKEDYKNGIRYKIMTSLPDCGFTVIEYETKPFRNVKTAFEHVSNVFNLGIKVRTFNNKALVYKESVVNNEDFKEVLRDLTYELQHNHQVKNNISGLYKEFLEKFPALYSGSIDFIPLFLEEGCTTTDIHNHVSSIMRYMKNKGFTNGKCAQLLGFNALVVYNNEVEDIINLFRTKSLSLLRSSQVDVWNHKVVSIEKDAIENVYDIQSVEETHTFAALTTDDSGIFIHNCADSFYNPIQLWSIGSYTGDPKTSIIPTEADLQQYRDMIEQATMTPPFSIYVPPFVKYEALGVQGKLLSVYEDLGYVENCIFVGLGVNKNLVLGSGPSFSSGKQISLYRLIKMYKSFRLKLEAFFKKYVILPIAKAADIRDEHSNYIIPEIKWSESLQPEQDKDLFDSLFKLYDKGLVSTQTLMEHFMIPLDMKLEQQRMEAEKRTIFDKGTDRLGAKVLREDLQNLDKSKMGGGSSSGPKSEPLAGGSSGGLGGGEEKLDLGKPYPGSAGSDKSSLPPPISGGAGVDKGEPTPSNETPTTPAEPAV